MAAAVLFLASLASLGVAMNALEATASLTIGITDAADSPSTIWQLEHRLSRNPTDAVRFVLAVCHHLAGHIERATELYEALPGNSRARKNLDALRAGDLVPPEPLRGEDQMAAWDPGHGPGPFLLGGLPRWAEMMEGVGWLLLPAIVHAITAFVAVILIGVLLLLPAPAPGPAPKPLVPSGGKHFVDRLPGIRDLCRGSPRRGYVGLTSAMFAIVAVLAQVYGTWKTGSGGTGFLGTDLPGMLKAFPLPPVPFWPIFWAYADAPHFWFAVCIAAATAVGLHLAGGRGSTAAQEGEASRPTRAEAPQEDPFVSS